LSVIDFHDNVGSHARVNFGGAESNQKARRKEPNIIIIGADYHPGFQQIAFVDTDTGEFQERRLQHHEEAEKFYRDLAAQGMQVRVGMEASGQARWFERLLSELHFERGSEMQRRSGRSESASRRRIARMRS
jgi:hypothetical protein